MYIIFCSTSVVFLLIHPSIRISYMIYKIILVYSTTAHIHLYLHYKSEWHHGSNAIVSSSCQNLCCLRMQRQVFRVLPQSYHLQGRQRSAWIAKDMGAMLWFKGILGIFIVAPLSKPLASSNASTAPVRDTPLCTFTPTCASDGMTALKSTSRMPLALSQVPSKGTAPEVPSQEKTWDKGGCPLFTLFLLLFPFLLFCCYCC